MAAGNIADAVGHRNDHETESKGGHHVTGEIRTPNGTGCSASEKDKDGRADAFRNTCSEIDFFHF